MSNREYALLSRIIYVFLIITDLAFLNNFVEHTVAARGFKICRLSWRHGEIYLRIFEFENLTTTFWIPVLRLFWIPREFCLRQLDYWKESFEFSGNFNYVLEIIFHPSAIRPIKTWPLVTYVLTRFEIFCNPPSSPPAGFEFRFLKSSTGERARGCNLRLRINAFRNLL